MFIGFINLQIGVLSYINAGNERPLLLGQEGTVAALEPTGPLVGVIPGATFAVKEIVLKKNDLLLIFTDGVPDACNGANDSWGRECLLKLLKEGDTTPARLLEHIEEQLRQFIGTADQFDDITLLAINRSMS
jgi:phosphoserine phosphatase RsbU/P